MLEIRDKLALEYGSFLNRTEKEKLYPHVPLPKGASNAGGYWGFYHGFTKAMELMNEQRRIQK